MQTPGAEAQNPFDAISELPYRLPPFERIENAHYGPAFERGMSEQLAEVEAIATDPEPPTFENTLVALERSGQLLQRVAAVFFNQASSDADDEIQAIQAEISPKLAAHSDAIHLDGRLFARIEALLPSAGDLDPESRRLLERYHLDFVRAGAGLTDEQQARLREINEELSALQTAFQNKLLNDTNATAVLVDDAAELDGLAADAVTAAAETARERGLDGQYVITLGLPSGQPVLTALTNRALRERIHRASISRGAHGDENDTLPTAVRIATLRAERAALFGHPDHATYVFEDSTAKTPAAVHDMLGKLTPAAVANAHAEAAKLQAAIGDEFELRAWDWAHYSDQVRHRTYDIDAAQLRPYFELDRVLRDGVFYAAGKLYGLSFTERTDLVGYHPDARVFEVFDEDGSGLGLFVGDFFTRDSKRGGAWMNSFVEQSELLGTKPVVVNNLNIVKPPAGEPALLTFDEVNTMFHEFGHALHGLFSDVTYPTFSGTSVPRDFVEFPSQVNEMWAVWPEVLANYAVHHETGEPLPPGADPAAARLAALGRGLRDDGVPGGDAARPRVARDRAGHGRRGPAGVRGGRTRAGRRRAGVGAAALPDVVLRARLLRRLQRGLLLLHLERGPRRRHASSGSRTTAACCAPTATTSAASCCRAAAASTRCWRSATSAAATRRSSRCWSAAASASSNSPSRPPRNDHVH